VAFTCQMSANTDDPNANTTADAGEGVKVSPQPVREPYSVRTVPVLFTTEFVSKKAKTPKAAINMSIAWSSLTCRVLSEWLSNPYFYMFDVGVGNDLTRCMSLVALLEKYGLGQIPTDLRGFFQITWEGFGYGEMIRSSVTAAPDLTTPTTASHYVFVFCTSPRTCKAVPADPSSEQVAQFKWGIDEYHFMAAPKVAYYSKDDPTSFNLPWAVSAFFFEKVLDKMEGHGESSGLIPDFTFQPYYTESMSSYSSLTFQRHTDQLAPFISTLGDCTIIAPGDGLGVVASLAEIHRVPCFSGDTVSRPSTHPSVTKEDLMTTFRRWKGKTRPIVILSYIWTFLSEEDKEEIRSADVCTLLLDSHLISLPHSVVVGPTATYRQSSGPPPPSREIDPEYRKKDITSLLFTENLINLQSIEYNDHSVYVEYYVTMRRLAVARFVAQPSGRVPYVVSTVHEYLTAKKRGWRNVYVACLGEIDPPLLSLPLLNCDSGTIMTNLLRERQIYLVPACYVFDNSFVIHGQCKHDGSVFWFAALKSGPTVAYPVLDDNYPSVRLAVTRYISENKPDACTLRFVPDGEAMLCDSHTFSRTQTEYICKYGGSEYRQKIVKSPWVSYLIFVTRFAQWELGPTPSCLLGFADFLKLNQKPQLPFVWSKLTWQEYIEECMEDPHYVNPFNYCSNSEVMPWDHKPEVLLGRIKAVDSDNNDSEEDDSSEGRDHDAYGEDDYLSEDG